MCKPNGLSVDTRGLRMWVPLGVIHNISGAHSAPIILCLVTPLQIEQGGPGEVNDIVK